MQTKERPTMGVQYKVFCLSVILGVIYSCKSYKNLELNNSCGAKEIESIKERPFKVHGKRKAFILSFNSGFRESKVKVIINDSIYMDKVLTSNFSTSYAGDLVLRKYTELPIKVYVDGDCFDFYLDPNYMYYEIHTSEKRFYLNIRHFPSIGE